MNHRRQHCHSHRRTPARFRRPGRRGGFSMIEILVVIGIILVLVGIAVIGFNALDRAGSRKNTQIALKNAQSLLVEYEQVQKLSEVERVFGTATPPRYSAADPGDGGNVNLGVTQRDEFYSASHPTRRAMRVLMKVPNNDAAVKRMHTKHLLKARSSAEQPVDPPAIADGWENPIIFVPTGGLTDVKIEAKSNQPVTVTSNGVINNNAALPAGARPFWASAGPDGDFTTGDDNVYSFEN